MDVGAAGGGGSDFQGYKMVPNTSYCLGLRGSSEEAVALALHLGG